MLNLNPKEIVAELDRFIIGQNDAKKAVAIALRNRYRRQNVDQKMRDEIIPHNILMVGPTGVGKTEISRRLAKLTSSPFIKVEATKFTEVGYVGRDVDSIIRDLVDIAINQVRERMRAEVLSQADVIAENRLIQEVVGSSASDETKEKFRAKFRNGELNEVEVEISLIDNGNNMMHTMDVPGAQLGVFNIGDILGKALGSKKTKTVKMKAPEAYQSILQEECDKMLNEEQIIKTALKAVEGDGIVFIDEIDKIASRANGGSRGEVSREGVQRDLLPLIEGTVISTKYGPVKTNHILFIASGAFHVSKPSDLLPELQGRLPVKVSLHSLGEDEMVRILSERECGLPRQYQALLAVEGVELEFSDSGIKHIAKVAIELNDRVENIGARRLQAVMEKVVEDISFNSVENKGKKIVIDEKYVSKQLASIIDPMMDTRKFIL
jgi:ATP-dependent HslUV protease ATP-binding subunit HslU